MFGEFLPFLLEEAARRSAYYQGNYNLRQRVLFDRIFFGIMVNISALSILVAGLIIRIEAFTFITLPMSVVNTVLVIATIFFVHFLWNYPLLATRIMVSQCIFIIIASAIQLALTINISLLISTSGLLVVSVFLPFPVSFLFLFCALGWCQSFIPATYLSKNPDKIDSVSPRSGESNDEDPQIEEQKFHE